MGLPWTFGTKNGKFFVDSVNYKKYREEQALKTGNIKSNPYANSGFGEEVKSSEKLLESDEEIGRSSKRDRIRAGQYDCQGLLIETNQFSLDCHRISFDKGAKVEKEVSASIYYSGDKYLLGFSENSTIKSLNIANIQSAELILDMDKVSEFNPLKTDSLKDVSDANLENIVAKKINDNDIVTLDILPEIAVVYSKIGSDNKIKIDGIERNKGTIAIATSDNQNYATLTTLKDLNTRNIKIGKPDNILVKNNNSISVKDDVAVAGNIYSSDALSIGDINLSSVGGGEVSYKDNIKIQDLTIGVVANDIENVHS
ncbi:MAG: hypothetical protein Rpha_0945 [Candidatus Ruthia sp. Apha_13_S6]|nr:hypothetical protein [Candidatus Ruthia sp. Apha_13_S6]